MTVQPPEMVAKTAEQEPGTPQSLASQAYAQLRSEILSGELKPGRKLKIDELRRRTGIGASPLREALSLLTSDGLVRRVDHRGFRVADVSQEEFNELLRTRAWLEERALLESIRHGGKDWEEAIVLAHYRLSRVPRSSDPNHFVANREWEGAHREFHTALIAACGSSLLLRYCAQLYDLNIRYRQLSGTVAYPSRDVTREHEEIMQATLDRDADTAVALLMDHYQRTGDFLIMAD